MGELQHGQVCETHAGTEASKEPHDTSRVTNELKDMHRHGSDGIAIVQVLGQRPPGAVEDKHPQGTATSPGTTQTRKRSCDVRAEQYPKKSRKANPASSTGKFSSVYRGVTQHRLTKRFEAHFWDASYLRPKPGKRTKGRQVYLGGYTTEVEAARAYDKAAISFLGLRANLNFPFAEYHDFVEEMGKKTPDEVVAELRRDSVGFARGQSQYRGVTRHHKQDRWEARIGRIWGNKYIYLGTFESAKEAAIAYDKAAVKFKGRKAMTNFPLDHYNDILVNPDSHEVPLVTDKNKDMPTQHHANNNQGLGNHQTPFNEYLEGMMMMHPKPVSLVQVPQQQVTMQPPRQNMMMGATGASMHGGSQPGHTTMSVDFAGNTMGNWQAPPHTGGLSAIDPQSLSPLAASLLSPLGIPHSKGNENLCRSGDAVSTDLLRMFGASDPFPQPDPSAAAQSAQQIEDDVQRFLESMDASDINQFLTLLQSAASPNGPTR
ncbi:hypothetical protein M9434_004109 [Picochlorum sp. BPE23]|nr:hypothetical protein M9434_004109 [Picochlorum sp. BPE23]